jgi:hypothetical protein
MGQPFPCVSVARRQLNSPPDMKLFADMDDECPPDESCVINSNGDDFGQ